MHPANALFHTLNHIADPLARLETEARVRWPDVATSHNGLRVLYQMPRGLLSVPPFDPSPTYIYEWGDAMVSRREAMDRVTHNWGDR